MCCPTMRVQQRYSLQDGQLTMEEETPLGPAAGVDTGATMTETAEMTGTEMTGRRNDRYRNRDRDHGGRDE